MSRRRDAARNPFQDMQSRSRKVNKEVDYEDDVYYNDDNTNSESFSQRNDDRDDVQYDRSHSSEATEELGLSVLFDSMLLVFSKRAVEYLNSNPRAQAEDLFRHLGGEQIYSSAVANNRSVTNSKSNGARRQPAKQSSGPGCRGTTVKGTACRNKMGPNAQDGYCAKCYKKRSKSANTENTNPVSTRRSGSTRSNTQSSSDDSSKKSKLSSRADTTSNNLFGKPRSRSGLRPSASKDINKRRSKLSPKNSAEARSRTVRDSNATSRRKPTTSNRFSSRLRGEDVKDRTSLFASKKGKIGRRLSDSSGSSETLDSEKIGRRSASKDLSSAKRASSKNSSGPLTTKKSYASDKRMDAQTSRAPIPIRRARRMDDDSDFLMSLAGEPEIEENTDFDENARSDEDVDENVDEDINDIEYTNDTSLEHRDDEDDSRDDSQDYNTQDLDESEPQDSINHDDRVDGDRYTDEYSDRAEDSEQDLHADEDLDQGYDEELDERYDENIDSYDDY